MKSKYVLLFTFGLVVLLLPTASGSVAAQAKSESSECAPWLKLIDASVGESSFAIDFPMSENEKLVAMECFLQSEGNQRPSRLVINMSFNGGTFLPRPTIEMAALYYVTYMFEEKWDHGGGFALWNKKAEINPPGSVQEAYRCYREWFAKLKELGFAEVKKQHLGPLDKSSVQWFLMGWPKQTGQNEELIEILGSVNPDEAAAAATKILDQREAIIPSLLKCKGDSRSFYGYGLGHRYSAFLLPLPTGNAKEDESRVITVEVAALYLISAIFYDSLEFAQAPYLTDGSSVKMNRFNTPARVSEAWRAVEQWHERLQAVGLRGLREKKDSPLQASKVHFWGTSESGIPTNGRITPPLIRY